MKNEQKEKSKQEGISKLYISSHLSIVSPRCGKVGEGCSLVRSFGDPKTCIALVRIISCNLFQPRGSPLLY